MYMCGVEQLSPSTWVYRDGGGGLALSVYIHKLTIITRVPVLIIHNSNATDTCVHHYHSHE